MKVTCISKNEKSMDEEVKTESNANFFYIRSGVMVEWLPEGQTVNQHYYIEVLTRLRKLMRKKRPNLSKINIWMLHQDNAPAHNYLPVNKFLADKRIPVLEHPPYLSHLAPCGFFLIPKLKSVLK